RNTWPARAPPRSLVARSIATPRSRPGCRSSTAATRRARTASCRSAAARSAAGRSTRSSTGLGRSQPRASARWRWPVRKSTRAGRKRMGRQYALEHYLERLERIREAVPEIAISTDVIVGFCGETEEQFESTLRLLERVRYDQVFAAAYSERPGTPATHLADDVPAEDKRRRLNTLLGVQEPIGLERNQAWLDRDVEVMVDAVVPPRSHDHDPVDGDEPPVADSSARRPIDEPGEGSGDVHLSGRTRQNKLVHLLGPASWLGSFVNVRIEHAGPYAL